MGPITLFDKSFLQSLNLDEAVLFDNFFLTNISPLFYVETLADLEKKVGRNRTPEREVGIIADKTPEMNSHINQFHQDICIANLLGHEIIMDSRILKPFGRPVKTADESGVVFVKSPEEEAFSRWQEGDFLTVERQFAKTWRQSLGNIDIVAIKEVLNAFRIDYSRCKNLTDAKALASASLEISGYSFNRFKLIFQLLGLPEELLLKVFIQWGLLSCPHLTIFAPYASFVLTIELFYYIVAASNLISQKSVTNKIDLAYLYYLPFCMIFVSTDRFHQRCAPLFMRDDQKFIWGQDLKSDLGKIDKFYSQLPDHEIEKGLPQFAKYPPEDEDFLVAKLWDSFLGPWRTERKKAVNLTKEANDKIIERFKKLAEGKPMKPSQVDFDISNPDSMIIHRSYRRRRGKYYQVPKGLKDID